MAQSLFVTGASGNTGRAFLDLLFRSGDSRGAEVRCLVLPGDPAGDLSGYPVSTAEGDARDPRAVGRAYGGEETIVHISSIFHSPAVIEGCRGAGRIVVVSSTGRFSGYRDTAGEIAGAEEAVERSGLSWTILRPTMIYGSGRDRNISKLIRLISRSRIVPLPGGGSSLFQPVTSRDLAGCILSCLGTPASEGRAYNISGGSVHSLKEIVRMSAGMIGRRVLTPAVPLGAAILLLKAAEKAGASVPVRPEQVLRLLEDKVFDHREAAEDLGFSPVSFPEGLRAQIEEMGLAGPG